MYDTHMHTHFSPDSRTKPQDMVEAAIQQGLDGICITDHVEIQVYEPPIDEVFSAKEYFEQLQQLKRKELDVLIGAEVGLQPHVLPLCSAFTKEMPYDFIIGSIHLAGKKDVYDLCQTKDPKDVIDLYYDDMEKCMEQYDDFDTLAHIDYVDRYFPVGTILPPFSYYEEKVKRILKILIEKQKSLEINTGGLRKSTHIHHPKTQTLTLYKKLGGKLITIGSDAHTPNYVAFAFKEEMKYAKDHGFTEIQVYKQRKKVPIRI